MKILAIGNSFSQDALRYLHDMAKAGDIETTTVNLYIGGCSLERHYNNMISGEAVYEHEINGGSFDCRISLQEALREDQWDVITLQQCSGLSGIESSYYPYIAELAAYVRRLAPDAELMLHQTWAYDVSCNHEDFPKYSCNQLKMYNQLNSAYNKAAGVIRAGVIPVGDCIQALRETVEFNVGKGGRSLCRDGYHLDLVLGRYAAAAVWYETVLGGDITGCSFVPECTPECSQLFPLIRETVHRICSYL